MILAHSPVEGLAFYSLDDTLIQFYGAPTLLRP
jgi:hypothetical protein